MIRLLQPDEVGMCLIGAEEFYKEGNIPGGFVPEAFMNTWPQIIQSDIGGILGLFKDEVLIGALGFLISPNPNNGVICAQELFWYVRPEYRESALGLKLFRAFEREALSRNCQFIHMAFLMNLFPEKIRKIYDAFGYKKLEEWYVKSI